MTILGLALLGGLLGAVLLDGDVGASFTGAALGALAACVKLLNDRVQELEQRSRREDAAARVAAPAAAPAAPKQDDARRETPPPRAAEPSTASAARAPLHPSLPELALERVRSWFTTGNVPVKVGVVLSVFGMAFLVKEAVNRNWMIIPIELRLAFVALFGIALLALGWRLSDKHRAYALSVQGGGVAVLYLTTYASFAIYGLLPAAAAFVMLLVVTVAVGALAVLQDARALAVLGVIGGFMAPVLTSNEAGSHVVLFGYYAVLNVAIVGVAWFKAWRGLNVLGFLFTFGIGSLWGYGGYRTEHFATTEPFLVLFVLMYTLIPVLFATRQAPHVKGFVDGTLLFGTPIAGFGLQTLLVGDTEYGLAISAMTLAALYVGLARFLYRRAGGELRVLIEALFSLSVVFLTIAVPLALDARWTSVAWALQGAAMIWLGARQQRRLALASGAALQLAAGAVHVASEYFGGTPAGDLPVLNGAFLGAVLIAAAGWLSGWLSEADRNVDAPRAAQSALASSFLGWGTGWWLLAGLLEIVRHVQGDPELAASLVFVGATALAAALAAPRIAWPRLNIVGALTLPAIALGVLAELLSKSHPLADYGWAAWPLLFAAHAAVLRLREMQFPRLRAPLHAAAYWALAALLAVETAWQIERFASGVWPVAAALAALGALILFTVRASATSTWPIGVHRRTYVLGGAGVTLAMLAFATFNNNLTSPGDPSPLPYWPVLNPLELTSVFVMLVLLKWWRAARGLRATDGGTDAAGRGGAGAAGHGGVADAGRPGRGYDVREPVLDPRLGVAVPALLGLFLLTMAVARTVHHWAGVPFDFEQLAASTQLQAALSIAWGTCALGAMLLGARAGRREVWLAGGALMAVVVAKLFLVELGNAGTVGRVVSFLGVGVLLLVVGYFAPVPPRAGPTTAPAAAERRA